MTYPIYTETVEGSLVGTLREVLTSLPSWLAITEDPDAISIGQWPQPDYLPSGPAALIMPPLWACVLHARETRRWSGKIAIDIILPEVGDLAPGDHAMACLAALSVVRDDLCLATFGDYKRVDAVEITTFEPGQWTSISHNDESEDPITTKHAGWRGTLTITAQAIGV